MHIPVHTESSKLDSCWGAYMHPPHGLRSAFSASSPRDDSEALMLMVGAHDLYMQANLERYQRMAREELAREEEEARKAGKPHYSL